MIYKTKYESGYVRSHTNFFYMHFEVKPEIIIYKRYKFMTLKLSMNNVHFLNILDS